MRHFAPLLALIFFTIACALIVAEAWIPDTYARYAIVALALSNACILWAYFGLVPPPRLRPAGHGRRKAGRLPEEYL